LIYHSTNHYLARAGYWKPPVSVPEDVIDSFRVGFRLPSFLAGIVTLAEAWLELGERDAVHRGVELFEATDASGLATDLSQATLCVVRAQLERAHGRPATQYLADARGWLARVGAPWWERRIAALQD
jgi:hypothetical protein